MASLAAIRDAVKTTLEANISGLRVHDTIPDSISPPALVIAPAEDAADFTVAMGRGLDTWNFDLLVLVSRTVARTAQDALDAYVTGAGASSIRQAIFSNKMLGLSDVDAYVASVSKYDFTYTVGSIDYAGATLRLIVHTSGTS